MREEGSINRSPNLGTVALKASRAAVWTQGISLARFKTDDEGLVLFVEVDRLISWPTEIE